MSQIAELIDLDRYPIHELDLELVTQCYLQLRDEEAVKLDGFLRPRPSGVTPRMNSVLTYAREPGHKLSAMAQQMYYYGRTA